MFRIYVLFLVILLVGCGGGGGGGGGNGSTATTSVGTSSLITSAALGSVLFSDAAACPVSGATVTISGSISYERVPFSSTTGGGLDYNNIQVRPARGVDVQALGPGDCVMASTSTSATGAYSLVVEQNTSIKIRVKARTQSVSGATWEFEVRDNTRSNGLYVMDGSSSNSGFSNSTRNLTAASGWGGEFLHERT